MKEELIEGRSLTAATRVKNTGDAEHEIERELDCLMLSKIHVTSTKNKRWLSFTVAAVHAVAMLVPTRSEKRR